MSRSFNGHPPLGVNATESLIDDIYFAMEDAEFQWAPTLGGECYIGVTGYGTDASFLGFNGHPPLGVNATQMRRSANVGDRHSVSMGTHPWG